MQAQLWASQRPRVD